MLTSSRPDIVGVSPRIVPVTGSIVAVLLTVQDSLAFVTSAGEDLAIIDVSNPSDSTEVEFIDTPGSAFNVSLDGGRVDISDGQAGLRIFGDCEIGTPGDLDGDGSVAVSDLLTLLSNWG